MNKTKYALFLRGVNVGGYMPIKMDVLKNVLIANQFEDVKTYVNSGNLIVSSPLEKKELKEHIAKIIQSHFNASPDIIIMTNDELHCMINSDPFDAEKETENAKKIAILLSDKIDREEIVTITEKSGIDENFYYNNLTLFVYYHNGQAKSRFTTNFIEKKFKIAATARNWNTLLKMRDLMHN